MNIIEIEYYTDPLCCWSWAMEPAWRRLRYEYGNQLSWKYRMSGMLPDWKNYNDSVNSVSRPTQMGPLWIDASERSGMPMDARLWVNNPPLSSYPACIAVKTAERQSAGAGEIYLRKVREAVMMQNRDVSQADVLIDIAHNMVQKDPEVMDYERFRNDLIDKKAIEDFKEDMAQVRQGHITRFPTLVIKLGEKGKVLTGYRPYEALREVLQELQPGIKPVRSLDSKEYQKYWGACLDRELEEIEADNPKSKKAKYADSLAS